MNLPDSMYYDDSHLNQLGVNIYNAKLIDTLKRGGVFNAVTGFKDSAKAYQASYQK